MAQFQSGFRLIDGGALDAALGATSAPPCGFQWFVGGPQANAPTIARAVSLARPGDVIYIAPGTWAESVALMVPGVTMVGAGPPNSVTIAPADNANAITLGAPYVGLNNLRVNGGVGAFSCIEVLGDFFSVIGCKCENQNNAGVGIRLTGAGTPLLTASQGKISGCEFNWLEYGIQGNPAVSAATEFYIKNCDFQNCTVAGIGESNDNSVLDMFVQGCTFGNLQAGGPPGAYISLNHGATNVNTGLVTGCSFPVALLSGGKNTVSTKIIWSGNFHTDGLSTGQPT